MVNSIPWTPMDSLKRSLRRILTGESVRKDIDHLLHLDSLVPVSFLKQSGKLLAITIDRG